MRIPTWLTNFDISGFVQTLREVVADPTSNLALAVLLLGMVSLVLLILVILILFFLAGAREEDEEEEPEDDDGFHSPGEEEQPATKVAEKAEIEEPVTPPAPPSRFARALSTAGAVLVPILVLAAVVGGYAVTSQDRYCLSCHAGQLEKSSALTTTAHAGGAGLSKSHARVNCVACHEGPQVWGAVGNSIDRLRHLAMFVAGVRTAKDATVDSRRCLGCHQAVAKGVLTDKNTGVKVSHAEPLAQGAECRECHVTAGHVQDARGPGMSACLRCHDAKTAKAECSTCHVGEPARASVDRREFVPQQIIGKGDCSGCHDQQKCDACHGLRMPHDIQFLAWGHARQAAFDGKVLCWRCHVLGDCGKCHETAPGRYWGHTSGTSWKELHATITPKGAIAGCGCHGRSPFVKSGQDYCLECHPPGIRNRVK